MKRDLRERLRGNPSLKLKALLSKAFNFGLLKFASLTRTDVLYVWIEPSGIVAPLNFV
jgi:hypothetical protein